MLRVGLATNTFCGSQRCRFGIAITPLAQQRGMVDLVMVGADRPPRKVSISLLWYDLSRVLSTTSVAGRMFDG